MKQWVLLHVAKVRALFTSIVIVALALSAALPAQADSNLRIAMLYDIGGRGDNGINDAAAAGLDAAKRQFHLSDLSVREMAPINTEGDRETRLLFLAKAGYDLIIAVGSGFAQAISVAAEKYPTVQFAIIGDSSVAMVNVMNIDFSPGQSAFMAGVLAGATSTTGKVGSILPADQYLAKNQSAFADGARFANPKVKVFSQSVPLDAKVGSSILVSTLTGQGVDLIYSPWARSSEVLNQIIAIDQDLMKKKSKTVVKLIGNTPQQYFLTFPTAKKVVIGAVKDRFDRAVIDLVAKTLKGQTFNDILDEQAGIYGHIYTFASGGVALATSTPTSLVASKVKAAERSLTSGKY